MQYAHGKCSVKNSGGWGWTGDHVNKDISGGKVSASTSLRCGCAERESDVAGLPFYFVRLFSPFCSLVLSFLSSTVD